MTDAPMKDFLGRELAVGDAVVFIAPGYRLMSIAQIIGFTPKKVKIEFVNTWNFPKPGVKMALLQDSHQLTRVDGVDLTMYLLGKA